MEKDISTGLIETLQEEAFTVAAQTQSGVDRQVELPKADNMIKAAIGMRRSGKSYFLYQRINKLLARGISKEQILFINFEDDRLLPMRAKEMGALIDNFYSLYPKNHQRRCFLFLDEVQNVQDWHIVVRRYFDSKDVQIYLTGSSAKLLSKEINTNLRGRSLSIEILPYSFQEYLTANKIKPATKPFGKAALDNMRKHLLSYFNDGGFPGVQQMQTNEWRETLQSYVDTVILKDIVERHGITNVTLLNYLANTLIKSAASTFSVNKFYNDIKSQGYKVSKDTIHNYLNYLQDAFLIFTIAHYSESERLKHNRPKKLYIIDNGLVNAVSLSMNKNYGRLLENLIYLDLRRQNKTIYFYNTNDGYEVDFVTVDQAGKRELLQITWDTTNEDTMLREQRALDQAEQELGFAGRIVTVEDYLRNGI